MSGWETLPLSHPTGPVEIHLAVGLQAHHAMSLDPLALSIESPWCEPPTKHGADSHGIRVWPRSGFWNSRDYFDDEFLFPKKSFGDLQKRSGLFSNIGFRTKKITSIQKKLKTSRISKKEVSESCLRGLRFKICIQTFCKELISHLQSEDGHDRRFQAFILNEEIALWSLQAGGIFPYFLLCCSELS